MQINVVGYVACCSPSPYGVSSCFRNPQPLLLTASAAMATWGWTDVPWRWWSPASCSTSSRSLSSCWERWVMLTALWALSWGSSYVTVHCTEALDQEQLVIVPHCTWPQVPNTGLRSILSSFWLNILTSSYFDSGAIFFWLGFVTVSFPNCPQIKCSQS